MLHEYFYVWKPIRRQVPYAYVSMGLKNALWAVAVSLVASVFFLVDLPVFSVRFLAFLIAFLGVTVVAVIVVTALCLAVAWAVERPVAPPVAGYVWDETGVERARRASPENPVSVDEMLRAARASSMAIACIATALVVWGWLARGGSVPNAVATTALLTPAAIVALHYAVRRLRQAFAPVYRAFHFSAVKWGLLFWVSELAAGSAIAGVLVLPLIDFSATSAAAFSYQLHWLVSISLGPLIVNAVDFVVLRRGRHLRTFDVAPFVTPAVRGTVAQQATDLNRTDGETGALVWDGDRLVGYVPPLALLMEPHTPLGNLLRPLLSATPIPRFYGGDVDPLLFFNPELEPEAVCVVQHEDDVVGYITTSIVVAAYSGLLNEKLRPDHQGDLPQGLS